MNNLTTKIIYVQPKDDDRKAWEAEESGAEQAARLILAHIEDISEISAMCNRDILERSGQIDPCDFEKQGGRDPMCRQRGQPRNNGTDPTAP